MSIENTNQIDVVLWAGGLGKRLQPLTFEDLGNRQIKRFPKGVLPLAGTPMMCWVLDTIVEGTKRTGWTIHRINVSTIHESIVRITPILQKWSSKHQLKVKFYVGNYNEPGRRFIDALSNDFPTLSCHDDALLSVEAVAKLLDTFSQLGNSIIAFSSEPSGGSVPLPQEYMASGTIECQTENVKLYHSPLRIYLPSVREIAKNLIAMVEKKPKSEFREFMLDRQLLANFVAFGIETNGVFNVNSPRDYLLALKRIIGSGNYIAPNALYDPSCNFNSVAIENGCVIGKDTIINNVILFPNVRVGQNCVIKTCIIGSDTQILDNTKLLSSSDEVMVIGNFKIIGGIEK